MRNGLIEDIVGNKVWYLDDLLHREDGPAIENANGDKHWFFNGKCHREDGPAVEYLTNTVGFDALEFWYINGQHINCKDNEEFLRIVKLKAFW